MLALSRNRKRLRLFYWPYRSGWLFCLGGKARNRGGYNTYYSYYSQGVKHTFV